MAGEVERKSRKRREKSSQMVCTAQGVASSKNSIELGLVFSFVVVALYLYGFFESIQALPDVATGRHLGDNLNLAKLQDESTVPNVALPQGNEAPRNLDSEFAIDAPPGKWPVTLKDELDDYETLIHTGDLQTHMSVPKFWAPPLHNKKAYTREQAMKVGTCAQADPATGNRVRGTECPPDERTIFIAIASYRDFQCRKTVETAFGRAKNPDRIRVGEFHFSTLYCD
jgi:hypothetical protein